MAQGPCLYLYSISSFFLVTTMCCITVTVVGTALWIVAKTAMGVFTWVVKMVCGSVSTMVGSVLNAAPQVLLDNLVELLMTEVAEAVDRLFPESSRSTVRCD